MNKRQLNKVIQLHKEGVSDIICVAMIMELCAKDTRRNLLPFTANKIVEFFESKEPTTTIRWVCTSCGTDYSVREINIPAEVKP